MANLNTLNNYGNYNGLGNRTVNSIRSNAYHSAFENVMLAYVHGIEGANAFQIPTGYFKAILWDEDNNSFYVKGYDTNGIPRILAWNDYSPHVIEEPEPVKNVSEVDMKKYATKDDIKEMINSLDLSGFMTRRDFDKALAELSVGERGRIVRINEPDA